MLWTLARLAAWSTSSSGVGQPSLAVVCMWRSARPGATMGVHPTADGLTIDLFRTFSSTYLAGGVGFGRLDAGLRALSSACALAPGTAAPEERGRDQARRGSAPDHLRRDGAAHQPPGWGAETNRGQARRPRGHPGLEQQPAPGALLRHPVHGRGLAHVEPAFVSPASRVHSQ